MRLLLWLALLVAPAFAPSWAQAPRVAGSFFEPTPAHLAAAWEGAQVSLPGGFQGVLRAAPAPTTRLPLVILMHGSSGLGLAAVGQFGAWLAGQGVAVIAPDSFATPDRLTYVSPVPAAVTERIHALRLAELEHALAQARALPWVDPARIIIAGSSEGAVPIGRLVATPEPAGRIITSWNCEAGYFVDAPRIAIPRDARVLTVVASRDPFFSPLNPWSAGFAITGNCAGALRMHADATSVVISTDQHTLLGHPQAREAVAGFVARVLGR
jgi:dienelactone hydrolase